MKNDVVNAIFPYLDGYDRSIISKLAEKGPTSYYGLVRKHKAAPRTVVYRHLFYELSGRPNLTTGGFVASKKVPSRRHKGVLELSLTLKGEFVAYLLGWVGFLDKYGQSGPWKGKRELGAWLKILKEVWILPRIQARPSKTKRSSWDRVPIWDLDFLYNLAFEGLVRLSLHKHLSSRPFGAFLPSPIPMPHLFEGIFDVAGLTKDEKIAVLEHLRECGWPTLLHGDVDTVEGWMNFRLSEEFQEPFPSHYTIKTLDGRSILEPIRKRGCRDKSAGRD